jgi:hypothetical protein
MKRETDASACAGRVRRACGDRWAPLRISPSCLLQLAFATAVQQFFQQQDVDVGLLAPEDH